MTTHRIRRFVEDCRANVTPIFALALIPLVALTGAAVDYSRANAVKVSMQAALDATALAMSNSATTLNATALQTQAQDYFFALFTRPEASRTTFTATYSTSNGSNLLMSGSTTVKTQFMGLMGIQTISVAANSTSVWGMSRLRVALALDNTGSMKDAGKIDALKTATKNLLKQLQTAAATNGDVYVSIIPFSRDVSVNGTSNYSGNWIDWSDWSAPPANSTPAASVGPGASCPYSNNNNSFTCTTGPANGSSTTNTIPSSGTYKGYICPSVNSSSGNYYNGCYNSTTYTCTGSSCTCTGHTSCSCSGSGNSKNCKTTNGKYEHAWIANATSTWNGCITDRGTSTLPGTNAGYDQNVTAPTSGNAASYYPSNQYSYCTLPMMGLNYNWSVMSGLVDQMTPNGATNQPIGLVWGWQSLVGGGPLAAPAMDPNYQYQQVIILLSDGLNTQDRWYGNGSSTSTAVDNRMYYKSGTTVSGTCQNIKNAKITIYTIQVNTGGDTTSTLLQNCASPDSDDPKGPKFFLLTTADQIITTFNKIGTGLSKLRISK